MPEGTAALARSHTRWIQLTTNCLARQYHARRTRDARELPCGVAPPFFVDDERSDQAVCRRGIRNLDETRALIGGVAAAPPQHDAAGREERWLRADGVPAIHAFFGIDANEEHARKYSGFPGRVNPGDHDEARRGAERFAPKTLDTPAQLCYIMP
jgi:hypothetical protein